MKRLEANVTGHVQGVFFRQYTRETAQSLGLVGWVRNERDGSVSVVAEGPEEALKQLEQFLQRGSPQAFVRSVEAQWKEPSGEFKRFATRYH